MGALARSRRASPVKGEVHAAAWALAALQAYLLDEATVAYEAGYLTVEEALKATNVAAPTLSRMLVQLGCLPEKAPSAAAQAHRDEPSASSPPVQVVGLKAARERMMGQESA